MPGTVIKSEINAAQERFDHAKAFYLNTRKARSKVVGQIRELTEKSQEYRKAGEMAQFKSIVEEVQAVKVRLQQLTEQMDKAKGVADADLGRLEDLKALQAKGGILPRTVVESFTQKQAHEEAVKIMLGKGLVAKNPKLARLEKKIYPGLLKYNLSLNAKGTI